MRKMLVGMLTLVMVLSLMSGTVMAEDHMVDEYYEEEYDAAPEIANMLLERSGIPNRYGMGRSGGNYISDVARHMGPGTDFDGIPKTEEHEYKLAIAQFLMNKGADVDLEEFESELEYVWYEGDYNKFGTEADETLTLTFSEDVFFDGVDQEDAGVRIYFEDDDSIGNLITNMIYTIEDNKIIITSVKPFVDPRPEIGDYVIDIDGIVDEYGNPVIIPGDGVMVDGDEVLPEAVVTMNHILIDPSNPVFADSGGYFLNMGFEVNRDLDLTHTDVLFVSYYEYKIGDEINIVNNIDGVPFARTQGWGFIRYGDPAVPESQPDILEAGTIYFFAATGNTNERLYSLSQLDPGTEYDARVVYQIEDEYGNITTTYSPWVAHIR